jgi:hypothetical protein
VATTEWESGPVSEHQVKVSANEDFWRRLQVAKTTGMLTNPSGLGQLAFSHAMEHGQADTEALLRSNGHAPAAGQAAGPLLDLALIEQLVAAGVEDVKRHITKAAAVVIGVLVLLAVGMVLYVRPVTSTA